MTDHPEQAHFFAQLAEPTAFRHLFDYIPDAFFFVKDTHSRLLSASAIIVERLGCKTEAEIVGTVDEDFFSATIAQGFREDDQLVFKTREPLVNRLEVWYDEQRNLDWFQTTKVPLFDRGGDVVGLMGVTRAADSHTVRPGTHEVVRAVEYLKQHVNRIVPTTELAEACGTSERTLYRRIQESLGVTPHELSLRVRIQQAAQALLKTDDSILSIALQHGFCDQSIFTQHFKKRTGLTPRRFRERHQA
jgi:AraC-like DNA-binding protein